MFKDFIENEVKNVNSNIKNIKSVCIYPISEYNLEAIKFLVDNCMSNIMENNNVTIATIDISLWLGDFLDKYWDKISYVSTLPRFDVLKAEGNKIVSKRYEVGSKDFHTEEELDSFFNEGKWKKFVIYNITKYADLSTMKTYYNIRYADITEKYEMRDNKINSILESNQTLGDNVWIDDADDLFL